jgi:CheY-like chemotaxis protein
MAQVLVVDDDARFGEVTRDELQAAGHDVTLVTAGKILTFEKRCVEVLEQRRPNPIDALVLDICFISEEGMIKDFGGFILYSRLLARGLRNTWRHTLVVTQFDFKITVAYPAGVGARPLTIDELNGEEMRGLSLRLFASSAGIPRGSVLQANSKTRKHVVERLQTLLTSGVNPDDDDEMWWTEEELQLMRRSVAKQ